MKTYRMIHRMAQLCLVLGLPAQGASISGNGTTTAIKAAVVPAPTAYRVVDRGPSHRLWQRETYEPGPNGQMMAHIHQYRELGSGMCYQQNGQWLDSQDLIEPCPSGAISQHGQYKVIFASDLKSFGAIDQQTPDQQRLRSNILGLAYYDCTTGNSILIAEVQDSRGELISSNQVLYPNAFHGLNADVRYTYRKGCFEQDVILRAQPPSPESYGLNPESVELEVITEFINPPQAAVRVCDQTNQASGEADEDISWGQMHIGRGKAFDMGDSVARVKVIKQYKTMAGRKFLLEKVPLRKIRPQLAGLPPQANVKARAKGMAAGISSLPKVPLAQRPAPMTLRKMAAAAPAEKGYVLDYIELNFDQVNYTFKSDTTYQISSGLNLDGATTLEGGTVIKFSDALDGGTYNYDPTSGTGHAVLTCNSYVQCETGPYRPAILTSMDDDSVGESISGSTGNPETLGITFLDMGAGSSDVFNNVRFMYGNVAVLGANFNTPVFEDCQFINCNVGFGGYGGLSVCFKNCLLAGGTGIEDPESGDGFVLENVTMDNANYNIDIPEADAALYPAWTIFGASYLFITNSLFAGGQTLGGLEAAVAGLGGSVNDANNADVSGNAFQTAGAGSYYLATGSPYHNAGNSNLEPALLADLAAKTTYPPMIYSNVTLLTGTDLDPQVKRDNLGLPDLGYHYDPLDYAFGGVNLNSNISFSAGTSVGWFELPGSGGPGYGLGLMDGMSAEFTGTATAPCVFARYNMVQEGGAGRWRDKGWWGGIVNIDRYNPSDSPVLTARFTRFYKAAADSNHFRDGADAQPLVVQGTDCEFLNGVGGFNLLMSFTNCLFERAAMGNSTSEIFPYEIYQNCTFHGGQLIFGHWEGGAPYWYSHISGCAFDGTTFAIDDPFASNTNYASYNYNAFLQGAAQPPTEATNSVTVRSFDWQTGWFGNYYLPGNSPLIQQGGEKADQVGLFHFTTQTSQVPETNSPVDIGYHYAATDAFGTPLDSNGDGMPDYLEDANGNGLVDGSETNWALAILTPPAIQTAAVNDDVVFSVVAMGLPPLTFQWYFNGDAIGGATNADLDLAGVETKNDGYYYAAAINAYGSVTSPSARLTVVTPASVTMLPAH